MYTLLFTCMRFAINANPEGASLTNQQIRLVHLTEEWGMMLYISKQKRQVSSIGTVQSSPGNYH